MLHQSKTRRPGDMKWGLAALILGLPLPFIIIAFLFFGR